jgi:hypothetical protein
MTIQTSRPPALRHPITAVLLAVLFAGVAALFAVSPAHAATPLGPPRYVPCPVPTDEPDRYAGGHAPFRCRSAVTDPNGLVVILREGRSADAGPGPFGIRHAAVDRGAGEELIARVVSTVVPANGEQRRLHYVAELGEVAVWVVVDRASSRQAPDTRPLGVITAFCRSLPGGEVVRCPDSVNAAA